MIWISPVRALTREILASAEAFILENDFRITAGVRTGDTGAAARKSQKKLNPNVLITTPESLHLLLASKGAHEKLGTLECIVADEWHELLGSKRGVLLELALSRLKAISPGLRIWGISATIGNMDQAMDVLLGNDRKHNGVIVRSGVRKRIEVVSLLPDKVEKMPWAGHLGIKLIDKVADIVRGSESTLIFTNVRSQCEIWYKMLLEHEPDLAGQIAIHHGSLDKDIRLWVEDAIGNGKLKAVVCTSSLDLGVDFGPVESIVQIGGPKGVSRFIQRAGRSGHSPGEVSKIFFLPTHSLELIEAAALRQALEDDFPENREPYSRCFDVLFQYLVTLAVGDGFVPAQLFAEIKTTHCFESVSDEEWNETLAFISTGGQSLSAYPEYKKVTPGEDSWKVSTNQIARRHRLSIGTIVGDTSMVVRLRRGGMLGHIEESFISQLNEGDAFWFAGQCVELDSVKELTAYVKPSKSKTARIPAWLGGKLPLSSRMSQMLRKKVEEAISPPFKDIELEVIQPIIALQMSRSVVPNNNQFLVEYFESDDGFHLVFFPFEGRFVHEGMASLFGLRMSMKMPISFSLAYNDYGFELLSDQPVPVEDLLTPDLFSTDNLEADVLRGVNAAELAGRQFRDIATIAGLIFRGYPGEPIRERHLQSSAQLIYKVLMEYDPTNLLMRQAFDEVIHNQLEVVRLRQALERIGKQQLVITYPDLPTPFAFPIMVDRLREKMSSEDLKVRIGKMSVTYSDD